MSNSKAAQPQLLRESPVINPRTGRVWRLTDVEVEPQVNALQASLQDPQKALAYLKANGFVTAKGKTPKKYGG